MSERKTKTKRVSKTKRTSRTKRHTPTKRTTPTQRTLTKDLEVLDYGEGIIETETEVIHVNPLKSGNV